MGGSDPSRPVPERSAAAIVLRVVAVVLLILAVNLTLGHWIRDVARDLKPDDAATLHMGVWATCALYGFLISLPFVPGVEIGIGLLSMFGASVAPHVYVATIGGLTLAFAAGRLIPVGALGRLAGALRLRRAETFFLRIAPLPPHERLDVILATAPTHWLPWLIRHRYIALAILLNLPGNAVIGGGGGIALAAGLSRLFNVPAFLAVVAVAVSPVPILVWMFGGPMVFGSE